MKKFLPFVLPIAALLLVIFFVYRWYQQRTETNMPTPEVTAGAEIEELSVSELESLERMSRGVGNYQTAKLSGDEYEAEARYEKKDDKVYVTVTANVPEIVAGKYELWLKSGVATEFSKSKDLDLGKAGYWAAVVISEDNLPLEIEVRLENEVLATGKIEE